MKKTSNRLFIAGLTALAFLQVACHRSGSQDSLIRLNQVGQREIVINVNGIKKTIPFIDSVGDPLNVGLDIGIVGVRKIN